jgi:hypothetical protein
VYRDMAGIPNNQAVIRERREKLFIMLTKGMRANEIAKELKVDVTTVSRDISFLTEQSQSFLNDLAKQTLPFLYQTSLESLKSILHECWKIYNIDTTDLTNLEGKYQGLNWNHKLSALKLGKDCTQAYFECLSQGPSVMQVKILEDKLSQLENRQISQ